jgi:hypothetical protein
MKGKLPALGALLTVFAIVEYLFYPHVFYPHSILPQDPQALAVRLLPRAIGSFRSRTRWTKRWPSNRQGRIFEVYTSYRDGSGVEADIDIWFGASAPHNFLRCWYVLGYPTFWQRLSTVRMANMSAIFDTALFRFGQDQGLGLLANTECYPTGCYESLAQKGGVGLRLPVFSEPAVVPTPIWIVVIELNERTKESPQTRGARLAQDFDRFAAHIDLRPLLAVSVAQGIGGSRGG